MSTTAFSHYFYFLIQSYDIDPTISEAYGHREKADSVEPPGEGQKVGGGPGWGT